MAKEDKEVSELEALKAENQSLKSELEALKARYSRFDNIIKKEDEESKTKVKMVKRLPGGKEREFEATASEVAHMQKNGWVVVK